MSSSSMYFHEHPRNRTTWYHILLPGLGYVRPVPGSFLPTFHMHLDTSLLRKPGILGYDAEHSDGALVHTSARGITWSRRTYEKQSRVHGAHHCTFRPSEPYLVKRRMRACLIRESQRKGGAKGGIRVLTDYLTGANSSGSSA